MSWNSARYAVHMRFHAELTGIVERRAKEILTRLDKGGWVKEYDEYNVTIEHNSSCHCPPEYQEFTFPAEWIFAENWETKVDAELAKERAKSQAISDKNAKIQEQQELKELKRLQEKFVGVK